MVAGFLTVVGFFAKRYLGDLVVISPTSPWTGVVGIPYLAVLFYTIVYGVHRFILKTAWLKVAWLIVCLSIGPLVVVLKLLGIW